MSILKIELDIQEIIDGMFYDAPEGEFGGVEQPYTFNDAIKADIIRTVTNEIKHNISENSKDEAVKVISKTASSFIDSELEGIILRKLRSGEIATRYNGFEKIDDLIERKLNNNSVDNSINRHIENKINDFTAEMKTRYDNVFAAKVVQSLHKNKMLDSNIAEMLLGGNDEK